MKQVISSERIPIKMWLDDIEEGALDQAKNLANLPFAYKHIVMNSDSHKGFGHPVGGVLATKGVVVSNSIGVDIFCSVSSMKTSLTELDQETIKKILGGSKEYKGGVRSKIPLGFKHHSKKQDDWLTDKDKGDLWGLFEYGSVIEQQYEASLKQVGTLGGGKMIASSPRV